MLLEDGVSALLAQHVPIKNTIEKSRTTIGFLICVHRDMRSLIDKTCAMRILDSNRLVLR